jgi:hypothetical protein
LTHHPHIKAVHWTPEPGARVPMVDRTKREYWLPIIEGSVISMGREDIEAIADIAAGMTARGERANVMHATALHFDHLCLCNPCTTARLSFKF